MKSISFGQCPNCKNTPRYPKVVFGFAKIRCQHCEAALIFRNYQLLFLFSGMMMSLCLAGSNEVASFQQLIVYLICGTLAGLVLSYFLGLSFMPLHQVIKTSWAFSPAFMWLWIILGIFYGAMFIEVFISCGVTWKALHYSSSSMIWLLVCGVNALNVYEQRDFIKSEKLEQNKAPN